jgi:hypothetical protein
MVTSLWNSHAAELFYAKACSLLLFWMLFWPFRGGALPEVLNFRKVGKIRRGGYGIVRDCTDSDTITGRP